MIEFQAVAEVINIIFYCAANIVAHWYNAVFVALSLSYKKWFSCQNLRLLLANANPLKAQKNNPALLLTMRGTLHKIKKEKKSICCLYVKYFYYLCAFILKKMFNTLYILPFYFSAIILLITFFVFFGNVRLFANTHTHTHTHNHQHYPPAPAKSAKVQ